MTGNRTTTQPVAVIGAGMAGLTCARQLNQSGVAVRVFEKSRGLGGRLACRRSDDNRFDHGAQYITARGDAFVAYMEHCSAQGAAAHWAPELRSPGSPFAGSHDAIRPAEPWWVGAPGMNALVKPMTVDLPIALATTVVEIKRAGPDWVLIAEHDRKTQELGPFRAIVVTAPAPQAHALLAPFDQRFQALETVVMAPCWAAMIGFSTPLQTSFGALRAGASDQPLAWIAHDGGKPGRHNALQTWVAHANANWTRANLEAERETVAADLFGAFADALCVNAKPAHLTAHRWRYALAEVPLGSACLAASDIGLFAAGDWCLAPRVEAAFDSGRAVADAVLARVD